MDRTDVFFVLLMVGLLLLLSLLDGVRITDLEERLEVLEQEKTGD